MWMLGLGEDGMGKVISSLDPMSFFDQAIRLNARFFVTAEELAPDYMLRIGGVNNDGL